MSTQLLHGDCRALLRAMPAESVDSCVTSPPYWGLRSYLPDDHPDKHLEIGSEPTLQAWVETMVEVFREVRRVLRPDGTLFLNLGDAYVGSRCGGSGWPGSTLNGAQSNHSRNAKHQAFTADQKDASARAKRIQRAMTASARRDRLPIPRSDLRVVGLKPKDMMGQPWRVAFALQADGWWLRQEIIWEKPNPMPESVRDRCTKAHEQVFLLSKSERYFWDFKAMQEPADGDAHARRSSTGVGFGHGYDATPKPRAKNPSASEQGKVVERPTARASRNMGRALGWRAAEKNNTSMDSALAEMRETRNPRSVWTIPTHGFKGAHFATFPPALAARCVRAGCPVGGTVLDPFGGAGTVGLEADRQHKHSILIDLDERNVPMARERITADSPLFAQVSA